MLTGTELGQAIESARKKKGVTKKAMAAHFDVKPPSIQDWVNRGTIDKSRLEVLWAYFADVVGPEHWGLTTMPAGGAPDLVMDEEAHRSAPTWPANTPTPDSSQYTVAFTASPTSLRGAQAALQLASIETALTILRTAIAPLDWGMRDTAISMVALHLEGKNSLEKTLNSLDSILTLSASRPTPSKSENIEISEKSRIDRKNAA